MHEKAKKKTAEKYTVQQLLEKVTLRTYLQQQQQQHDLSCFMHFDSDHLLYVCVM